jgi:F420-dependent oxidoreductase-like protein
MKTAISVGSAYYNGEEWDDLVSYVVEAERLGVDMVWSAEAWGMDAVVPLAYLAARTERIVLGTGIAQITARVPTMTAMTAQSLDTVSRGRFVLGLGVSGPQVVEGLHGAPFGQPLKRLREYVDVVRLGLSGKKVAYRGKHYVLPRPGGEGKAIRLSQPPRPNLPIYLATLGPKSLAYTGEVADGWLGTSFLPERADVFFEHLELGAERAGRTLGDLDLQVGGSFEISDDVELLVDARRGGLAFTLGGMGSAKTNFYNEAFQRAGFVDAALEVQRLWVAGKRDEAIARVPDEMVLGTHLIGTEEMVRGRLRAYRDAGINTLRLAPAGGNWRERLASLEHALELVRSELG